MKAKDITMRLEHVKKELCCLRDEQERVYGIERPFATNLADAAYERVYGEVKSLFEWSKQNTGGAWESLLP